MAPTARARAQGFVDHLNGILNTTVTDGRLSLVPDPRHPASFHFSARSDGEDVAMPLHGSRLFLFVKQIVVVGDHVQTQQYSYRLQCDPRDRRSDILRWEHSRDRPEGYGYALSHVHINGELVADPPTKTTPRIHIPTGRVALELVLWHLLAEWGVESRTDDWQSVLQGSLDGFRDRRTD